MEFAEKPEMIPYLATGTGGPPKPKPPALEWKVETRYSEDYVHVALLVDGDLYRGMNVRRPRAEKLTARQERRLLKRVARAKEGLLRLYHLTLRESGRVE